MELKKQRRHVGPASHGKLRRAQSATWLVALTAAVLGLRLPAAPAQDAPPAAPAQPEKADPAKPEAPGEEPASKEEIRAAQIKMRQAEAEFVQAKIELAQLRKQEAKVTALQARLEVVNGELTKLNGEQAEAEGFIRKWLVLGPVAVDEKVSNHDETSCKEMLDRAYVPAGAKPKAGDTATIDGAELTWTEADAADFFVDLSKVAEDEGKNPENAAYLGVVYVTSEQEVSDVKLAIGSDDDSAWRLNGKEVFRSYEGRAVDKDQNTAEGLILNKGVNVLSFTVLNGDGPAAAAARFLDKDGNPLKGLTVSVNGK